MRVSVTTSVKEKKVRTHVVLSVQVEGNSPKAIPKEEFLPLYSKLAKVIIDYFEKK